MGFHGSGSEPYCHSLFVLFVFTCPNLGIGRPVLGLSVEHKGILRSIRDPRSDKIRPYSCNSR